MLQVRDIYTYYDTSLILQGVSIDVPRGKVVAVLGRNGVGKTTLVRSIVGITPPRRGRILYEGDDLVGKASHVITGRGISLVPQGRRIFPSLSVREKSRTRRAPRARTGFSRVDTQARLQGLSDSVGASTSTRRGAERRGATDACLRPRAAQQPKASPHG